MTGEATKADTHHADELESARAPPALGAPCELQLQPPLRLQQAHHHYTVAGWTRRLVAPLPNRPAFRACQIETPSRCGQYMTVPTSPASSSASLRTASDTASAASMDRTGAETGKGAGSLAGTYADEKRRLNKLVNDSRAASVDIRLALPTAVVIGDQSAGKSSLIEGLANIALPRATQTCTRVPTEIRLRSAAQADTPWSCQVSIRKETDKHGKALLEIRTDEFGPLITDPAEVTQAVQRAQLAALSPHIPFSSFLGRDQVSKVTLSHTTDAPNFSRNVIVLEITGPDVTDLTVVDLPGIVHNNDDDERLVIDLINHYISPPSAIILLTLAASSDIDTAKAFQLARKVDTTGERTLGIFTKVDRVEGIEAENWLGPFRGDDYKRRLHLGYFPTADELNRKISADDARSAERAFFARRDVTQTLTQADRRRLGTDNLRMAISDVLAETIRAQVPELTKEIYERLEATTQELAAMPRDQGDDYAGIMLRIQAELRRSLDELANGDGGAGAELIQGLNAKGLELKFAVRATQPDFIPHTADEIESGSAVKPSDSLAAPFKFDRPSTASAAATTPTPFSFSASQPKSQFEQAHSANLGLSGFNQKPASPASVSKSAASTAAATKKRSASEHLAAPTVFNLSDVRERISKSRTRELPHNVPFRAKRALIDETIATWPRLVRSSFAEMSPIVEAAVMRAVDQHCGTFSSLKSFLRNVAREALGTLAERTRHGLDLVVRLEMVAPFSLNEHYFSEMREKTLAELRQQRNDRPATSTVIYEHRGQRAGFKLDSREELCGRLTQADPWEQELIVMAEVFAYFRIAYKRIVDNIPRVVDLELVRELPQAIFNQITKALRLAEPGASERCKRLLAEDTRVVAQRQDLIARKKKLEELAMQYRDFANGM